MKPQAPACEDEEGLEEIFPSYDPANVTKSAPTPPRDDRGQGQVWLGTS
jgi:hypothetical protein